MSTYNEARSRANLIERLGDVPQSVPMHVERRHLNIGHATTFTVAYAAPELDAEANTLYVYDGAGAHRSWGTPRFSSTIHLPEDGLIVVVATGWHKHGSVGLVHYFLAEKGGWKRVRATHTRVRALLDLAQVAEKAMRQRSLGGAA